MPTLERKIPPPALAALAASAMWAIAKLAPAIDVSVRARLLVALALALVGCTIDIAAIFAFWRARTTINPLRPEATSAFVCSGVYRLTRNPMYLGLVLVLVGWAAYLASAWSLLGPVAFAFYVTRFQIVPEERALAARFGPDYSAYCAKVRRWL